jgi:hypothetical protein
MTNVEETKIVVDVGLATSVITMPLWVVEASYWIQLTAGILGLILIIIRLISAFRDWNRGNDTQ